MVRLKKEWDNSFIDKVRWQWESIFWSSSGSVVYREIFL
jgi:hypothetical protein